MNTSTHQNVHVGVDTGKSQLDIFIRPLDIFFTVNNDEKGIKEAIKTIKQHVPQRVVVEATGRLEMPFIIACSEAKLPFVIANPIHIKRFAGAIGQRAKTDKLDARLIAHYSEAIQPNLTQLKPENMRLMSDLVARRHQLLVMQTMEKNRLQSLPKHLAGTIKPVLTTFKNQIEKTEQKILSLIESCPEYQNKNRLLQSVPVSEKSQLHPSLATFLSLGLLPTNKPLHSLVLPPSIEKVDAIKASESFRGDEHKYAPCSTWL